jgi:hypothetical protein
MTTQVGLKNTPESVGVQFTVSVGLLAEVGMLKVLFTGFAGFGIKTLSISSLLLPAPEKIIQSQLLAAF